ncbi:MAG: methylmalonyl Co-A mutase-associated GTPase MeaB, partial [Bacteroidota bacterium]
IAGLADTTVVVVVPEAGDEVQTMKAGLMEIADIFVVNKADRPDADMFVRNLRLMMAPAFQTAKHEIAIVKTVASRKEGTNELYAALLAHQHLAKQNERKFWLLAERAYHIIQQDRMKDIDKAVLKKSIAAQYNDQFNLYALIEQFQ